jgi:uncharacterized protein YcnI
MRRAIPAAVAALVLLLPAAASAHVTVLPATAPSGGFVQMALSVPTERSDKGTVKVDVQLPPGVISASYEPVPGWSVKLTKEKLATPIKTEDGFSVDEQVSRITWTGKGPQGVIPPNAYQNFGLTLKLPTGKPGQKLQFKALQTYQGGEIVRWIGPESSDEPAPSITLTAPVSGGGHGVPDAAAESGTAAGSGASAGSGQTAAATTSQDDGSSNGLAIAALVVGALGLVAGIAGLLAARRARAAATARDSEGVAA